MSSLNAPNATGSSTETESVVVPIDHHRRAAEEIDTQATDALRPLTLMELVEAVSEVAETEQEVLATVDWMIRSGRVQLAPSHASHETSPLASAS